MIIINNKKKNKYSLNAYFVSSTRDITVTKIDMVFVSTELTI